MESIELTRAGAVDGAYGAALSQAALLLARIGDARGALEGLREAIAYSHDVGDLVNVTNALNRGIEVIGRVGDPEVSATLMGVLKSQLLVNAMMYQLQDVELEAHEEVQRDVRAALGDAKYEACGAQGISISYDEVVGYALSEIDRMLAELDDA
jgi:hypothetical protein